MSGPSHEAAANESLLLHREVTCDEMLVVSHADEFQLRVDFAADVLRFRAPRVEPATASEG